MIYEITMLENPHANTSLKLTGVLTSKYTIEEVVNYMKHFVKICKYSLN